MCYNDILFILGTRHTITPELISLYIEEIFNDFLSSLFTTTTSTTTTNIENDVNTSTTAATTTIATTIDHDNTSVINAGDGNNSNNNNSNNNTKSSTNKQLNENYNAYNILQSHELIDNFLFNNVGIWDHDSPEVPIVEYDIEQTELNIIKLDKNMKNLSFNKLASMDEVHQQMIDTQENGYSSSLSSSSSSTSSSHELTIHDTLNRVKSKVYDKFFYYIDNNNDNLKKMMMFKNNLDELFHTESIEKERMMEILHSWVCIIYLCVVLYVSFDFCLFIV